MHLLFTDKGDNHGGSDAAILQIRPLAGETPRSEQALRGSGPEDSGGAANERRTDHSSSEASGGEGLRGPGSSLRGTVEELIPLPADQAETLALTQPQVGCQVIHRFGPGVYIRECHIPAGVFVVGKRHRYSHTNVMLAGAISMSENDGPIHVVTAPHFYISPPGRKQGLALTDVVWQNIYATRETDVDALERQLFELSPEFEACANEVWKIQAAEREVDRQDFHAALDEYGFTPYEARRLSEIECDLIPMPVGYNIMVRQSAIEGKGIFVQRFIMPGEIIGPARIEGERTPLGRFTNHAQEPNAEFQVHGGNIWLVATKTIQPYCNELVPGDEVTVDYRQALNLVGKVQV